MRHLAYLNKYFLKHKYRFALGILFVTASVIYGIIPAKVVRVAIDFLGDVKSVNQALSGSSFEPDFGILCGQAFIFFAFVIVAAALIRGLFMFFMRLTLVIMSRLIEYDLKNEIYSHYQDLSLAFFKRNNTGDLMARIHEDVSKVRMYMGPAILYAINLAVLVVLVVANMLSVSVTLTIYVLIPLPILSFTIFYVSKRINIQSEKVQKQLSALSTFVQEAFSGIRVLKAYVAEDRWQDRFGVETESYKQESMNLVKINAVFFPTMILLIGSSTLLTIYLGGQEVFAGRISTGNIAEFVIYINQLTWPVAAIGWVTSIVQRAAASQQRINEFLHEKPDLIQSESDSGVEFKGAIEFEDVSMVYPDSGIKALNKVSFKLEQGKSLAILGKTGSGKSTIAALLTRTYDPTEGVVKVGSTSLADHSLSQVRERTGYVPQDVFLFSDTISNNISFGLTEEELNVPGIEDRVKRAADQADILQNILDFPNGLDTYVGERGITLSGGQKQRISIARAIIKDPRIMIFDDCLSAVDTETEEKILGHLRKLMKDRTTIIISHRVSSVKEVDQIIVLEDGAIIEQGDHQELLNSKGAYFELYQKQLMEEQTV